MRRKDVCRRRRRRCRGCLCSRSFCNRPPPLDISSLVALLIIVVSIANHDRSLATTTAWTVMNVPRSCCHWFASRPRCIRSTPATTSTTTPATTPSAKTRTSLFLRTTAAHSTTRIAAARTFLDSKQQQQRRRVWGTRTMQQQTRHGESSSSSSSSSRRNEKQRHFSSCSVSTATSSSRLYGHREFLEQNEHDKIVLSYVTDIEGDKFYLDRYVDNSKLLTWTTATTTTTTTTNDAPPSDDEETTGTSSSWLLSYYSSPEHTQSPPCFPYDRRIEFLDSNSMLIFGGDLWDKGGFDLYVTRQLLDLKRRYPDRVHWVLGNRDINKLRMMQELGLPPSQTDDNDNDDDDDDDNDNNATTSPVSVPYHPGLTWFRGSGRVGDPEGPLPSMDPGDRLRWILGNTMGSPDAMDHRRQELAWEARGCKDHNSRSNSNDSTNDSDSDNAEVTDDGLPCRVSDCDVVRSYQESCHPRGEMGRFLSEGLLAAKIGPVLFVHGSLPLTKETMDAQTRKQTRTQTQTTGDRGSIWDDLTFCMPWINKTHHEYGEDHRFETALDLGVETIEDWLEAVNRFARQNVEAWEKDIARLESEHGIQNNNNNNNTDKVHQDETLKEKSKNSIWAYRSGYGNGPSYSGVYYSDLIQYGMGMIPGGKKNPTVVYNSFTPEGMPTFFLPPKECKAEEEQEEQFTTNTSDKENGGDPNKYSNDSESDVAICTREFFERSSMRLILSGHKPQGDMPSPIRVDRSSWVICADTSYSGDTKWFHDERNSTNIENVERRKRQEEEQQEKRKWSNLGRGNSISFRGDTAVSEVLVELSGKTLSLESVRYHGVLSDGTAYESINLLDADDYEDDAAENSNSRDSSVDSDASYSIRAAAAFLGRVAPTYMVPDPSNSPHEGPWWTKGICRDGSHLYYAGEGYNVWNYIVSPSDFDWNTKNRNCDEEIEQAAAKSDVE